MWTNRQTNKQTNKQDKNNIVTGGTGDYNKAAVGKTKSSSFVTGVELSPETRTTKYPAQNNKPKYPCPWCMKSHDFDECFQFGKNTIEEKCKFLRDRRMCFACYGLNHTSKFCVRKRRCKACGKNHPSLHVEKLSVI